MENVIDQKFVFKYNDILSQSAFKFTICLFIFLCLLRRHTNCAMSKKEKNALDIYVLSKHTL